jgi:radical SAM protein with 4Fe4S-binding SPASM domain
MTMRVLRSLLTCITPLRAWNAMELACSYGLSMLLRRPVAAGLPAAVTIEPTNRCNLSCPECPSGSGAMTRPQGFIPIERFDRILDEIAPRAAYLQLFFQGEPLLHADLVAMVERARRRRLFVSVSTNAQLLREETVHRLVASGLNRLIVSMDGASEESYRAYREGGSLARVLEALELLRRERELQGAMGMDVVVQMLVTRQNEAEIPEARRIARQAGARLELKSMQVYSAEGAERFLPSAERYRRYRIRDGRLEIKSPLASRCGALWFRTVITWDGAVVPCCFDKDAAVPLGAIDTDSLASIWRGDAYQSFRRRILASRATIPMCRNCTEGLQA